MPTPRGDRTLTRRWACWQRTPLSQRYLAREAAAQGYTLLKVAPQSTAAFFACVELLQAQARCAPVDDPALTAAYQAWETWTRRLAAGLERLAAGHADTLPPVPDALTPLLDHLERTHAV
jgi:hypothetical protein